MISIVWRYLVWDADLRGIGVGAKIFDKNFSQTGVQLSVGSACCTPPSVVHKTHVCSKLSCCSKFYIYFYRGGRSGGTLRCIAESAQQWDGWRESTLLCEIFDRNRTFPWGSQGAGTSRPLPRTRSLKSTLECLFVCLFVVVVVCFLPRNLLLSNWMLLDPIKLSSGSNVSGAFHEYLFSEQFFLMRTR